LHLKARGNPCGPTSIIKLGYVIPDLHAIMRSTPYSSGMADIALEGDGYDGMYEELEEQVAPTESVKETCQLVADLLTSFCPPNMAYGYLLRPGYVPDGNNNAPVFIYPCGKPKGHHWHEIDLDAYTGKAIKERIKEEVGNHDKRSLAKIMRSRLGHTWS
jgi:hypothetical protein